MRMARVNFKITESKASTECSVSVFATHDIFEQIRTHLFEIFDLDLLRGDRFEYEDGSMIIFKTDKAEVCRDLRESITTYYLRKSGGLQSN
jgi:hypothetical protein